MLGYLLIGTNDLPKAVNFYEDLLSDFQLTRAAETDRIVLWFSEGHPVAFGVSLPADGQPATNGNGTMPAIAMQNQTAVDQIFEKAMALGATEAVPTSANDNFYGRYIRDLDNNKICFYCMPSA